MDNTTGKIYCSGCQKYFASNSAHSKHRISEHAIGRRCMTEEEMRVAGMDSEKKNVRLPIEGKEHFEEHDVWFDAVGREKMRAAFQESTSDQNGEF